MSAKGEAFHRVGPVKISTGKYKRGTDEYYRKFREAEEKYFAEREIEKLNEEKPIPNPADPEYMHNGIRTEKDTEVYMPNLFRFPGHRSKNIEYTFSINHSPRFFDKKNRTETNMLFLKCVCGGAPQILQGQGNRVRLSNNEFEANPSWSVCCPRCEISIPYFDSLEEARQIWNRHCLFGIYNQGLDPAEWLGDPLRKNSNKPLNNLEKLDSLHKNYHEYFYMLDYKYMIKIQRLLSPGMIFDDYSDLCAYLNEAVHTPVSLPMIIRKEDMKNVGATRTTPAYDSDKKHSKWWSRFFEFEKWGQKFVITKVYDEPKPYSKNKTNPNKGRTIDSFRPKLATETLMDEEIIGLIDANMIRYDYKKALNAISGKKVKQEARKAKREKREYIKQLAEENYSEEEIAELVNEEYEIYEDEDDVDLSEEEMRRLYGLEDEVEGEMDNESSDENNNETL